MQKHVLAVPLKHVDKYGAEGAKRTEKTSNITQQVKEAIDAAGGNQVFPTHLVGDGIVKAVSIGQLASLLPIYEITLVGLCANRTQVEQAVVEVNF